LLTISDAELVTSLESGLDMPVVVLERETDPWLGLGGSLDRVVRLVVDDVKEEGTVLLEAEISERRAVGELQSFEERE
jgi:hypothetical protein